MHKKIVLAILEKAGREKIDRLITEHNVDLNQRYRNFRLIEFAVQAGCLETVRYLIEDRKVNIEREESFSNLLELAVGHPDIATYFANPAHNIIPRFNDGTTYLHAAVVAAKVETIFDTVDNNPAELVKADNHGRTAFWWAQKSDNFSLLTLFTNIGKKLPAEKSNDTFKRNMNDYFLRHALSNRLEQTVESFLLVYSAIIEITSSIHSLTYDDIDRLYRSYKLVIETLTHYSFIDEADRLDACLRLFQLILTKLPNDDLNKEYLAKILKLQSKAYPHTKTYQLGLIKKAINILAECENIHDHINLIGELCREYVRIMPDQYQDSEESLLSFISFLNLLDPHDSDTQTTKAILHFSLGRVYLVNAEHDNALQNFERSLTIINEIPAQSMSKQNKNYITLNLTECRLLIDHAIEGAKVGNKIRSLGLKQRDMPHDGNCFFNTLADQIASNHLYANFSISHECLRSIAVSHLTNNREAYSGFVMGEFDQYIQSAATDRTWADHMMILALSRELKLSFYILSENDLPTTIIKQPDAIASCYFYFIPELHYQSLITIDEELKSSKVDAEIANASDDADDYIITGKYSLSTKPLPLTNTPDPVVQVRNACSTAFANVKRPHTQFIWHQSARSGIAEAMATPFHSSKRSKP